jgi:xanthine dehydrogenase YagS FAD-binding subunit
MKNFAYARAEDVGAAIQSITQLQNAKFLGGGTNLVDLMRENIEQPDHLVDLTALPLAQVDELPGGGMSIGALVTNSSNSR